MRGGVEKEGEGVPRYTKKRLNELKTAVSCALPVGPGVVCRVGRGRSDFGRLAGET